MMDIWTKTACRRGAAAETLKLLLVTSLLATGAACVPGDDTPRESTDATAHTQTDAGPDSGTSADGRAPEVGTTQPLPYARRIIDFRPGPGAGFGRENLPDVVLGPPDPKGVTQGSLDVLSLGSGGTIIVGFGENAIVDEEGADFLVFENAFFVGGDPDQVWAEVGEVSVSVDGNDWKTFECDAEPDAEGEWPGCAGWHPTRQYDPAQVVPPNPAASGGDAFDLADVGLEQANFVRIRDVSMKGAAPSAGFDLDAVGIVHPMRGGSGTP